MFLGKFVAIGSAVLGIFTFFSLVTALIINSKSATFVSSRFSDKMAAYANSSGAQKIIDRVQNDYNCCGESSWVDWGEIYFESATSTITTTTITSLGTRTITIITTPPSETTTTPSGQTGETVVTQTGETTSSGGDTNIPVTGETIVTQTEETTSSGGDTNIPVTGDVNATPGDETTSDQAGETTTTSSDEAATSMLDIETESTSLATVRRQM